MMRPLHLKLGVLLAGSILTVMLIATAATTFMFSSSDPNRLTGIMADRLALSADLVGTATPESGERGRHEVISDDPAPGTVDPELTAALTNALNAQGITGTVIVTIDPDRGQPVASYQLSNGRWVIAGYPRPQSLPQHLWLGLFAWLVLVLIGVGALGVAIAGRVTQPFVVLEQAIASVGSDGVLPYIPETGTGAARHTARALNRLSDRLKASMESRMRLVAAAGHDLRTPITRMRLRAEFLSEEERQSWVCDLDELELIADSAIRLVREEGAREDETEVDLRSVVEETVSDLSASHLPVTLTAAESATIKAGPLSLRRALRNLMINAATHGGGARVQVTRNGTSAQVVIEDDGPGIPEELIPQVFEPFFRVDAGRRKSIEGAGLGLAISKEILERFGGSIGIENRPGGGLRQTVTLRQVPA
jgi:signal transduction histidine kinase